MRRIDIIEYSYMLCIDIVGYIDIRSDLKMMKTKDWIVSCQKLHQICHVQKFKTLSKQVVSSLIQQLKKHHIV